tara:strand:+ start:1449 stop:1646 length:198 start_codon:yes stop_codon:yes gene_type:complete
MDILEEYKDLIESDPILQYLTKYQKPVTRESYLIVAYPDLDLDYNKPLEAELESMLPEFLQIQSS